MNLRDKFLQEALKDLEQVRLDNQLAEQKRFGEIAAAIPQIADLRENLANQTSQFFTRILGNPAEKESLLSDLRALQEDTDRQIKELLVSHQYPEDYLQKLYHCSACQDSGYLPNLKPCTCLNKLFIAKAYRQSNLESTLSKQNFEYFSFDVYSKETDKKYGISPYTNMETIYDECYQFAHHFGKRYQNLLLYGPSGLGKTFLCSCIAKEVLDGGFSVIYLSAPEFFGYFEKYHFHHDNEVVDYAFLEAIYECDLLILDDLGTEVISVVTQSDLFQTLNRRISEQKCTVISTNFSVEQLSKIYSERIASRILGEYSQLLFFGQDIRKRDFL